MSVRVNHLSFSYGQREVLRDISFAVEKGEFLSVLGPNGAGKSTLFRCVLGLLSGYTGKVWLNDRNVKEFSVRELAGQIAYIPQSSHLVFHYSVLDIVLMGRTHHFSALKGPGRADVQCCLDALEKIDIGHMKDRCFHKLSGGEQQLVLIARALAQDAPVLMLDEPTANLDFGNQLMVLKQVKALAREGYTVIQTTHHPEQSYLFSDRILALQNGRVVANGTPAEVLTNETMKQLYNVDVNVVSLYDDKTCICVPAEFVKNKAESI